MALEIKNPPANAGGLRDTGSIPGSEGMATHSSFLAWRIPQIEEPDVINIMQLTIITYTHHVIRCIMLYAYVDK